MTDRELRQLAIQLATKEANARERIRQAYLKGDAEEEAFAHMELNQIKDEIDQLLTPH